MDSDIIVETPSTKKSFTLISVKFKYDRGNRHQVLAAMRQFYSMPAAEFTAEMIAPFIISGADPVHWYRVLRDLEFPPRKPKPKRKRTGRHRPSKRGKPAAEVLGRIRAGVS